MRKEAVERFFRAAKRGLRGRKRFIAPIVGLAMLSACTNPSEFNQILPASSQISEHVDQQVLPEPPLIVPDPDVRNYCEPVSEKSDPVYQAIRGTPVPTQEVSAPPVPEEEKLPVTNVDYTISPADIVRKDPLNPKEFQAVLFPVGYRNVELTDRMEDLVSVYERVYKDISVQFSYLNISVPLRINQNGRLGTLANRDEYEKLIQKIAQSSVIDVGVVIINTSERFGGCCPPIIAGESNKTNTDMSHELGHEFGLFDGDANGQFKPEGDGIRNEAVFTKVTTLSKDAKEALRKTQMQIFYTGGNCNGEPVFTLGDPRKDIMINYVPDNGEFISNLDRGENIFDPAQEVIMDNNAQKRARRRIVSGL